MSMLDCGLAEPGGAEGMWATWQNSWNKWQKLSLLACCPIKVQPEFQLLVDAGITAVDNSIFSKCT